VRYKVAPDPDGADLATVQRAVPLVPDPSRDCCASVRDATGLSDRETAREWLTFATALGLVAETDRRHRRTDGDPASDDLRRAFERNVFGVREIRSALADDGPLPPSDVFERLRPSIPDWERGRHADWEREWHERTRRLLAWGRRFGSFAREDDRYRLTE